VPQRGTATSSCRLSAEIAAPAMRPSIVLRGKSSQSPGGWGFGRCASIGDCPNFSPPSTFAAARRTYEHIKTAPRRLSLPGGRWKLPKHPVYRLGPVRAYSSSTPPRHAPGRAKEPLSFSRPSGLRSLAPIPGSRFSMPWRWCRRPSCSSSGERFPTAL